MFSRNNERQSGTDRPLHEEPRPMGMSTLPSTGIRDAIAMPITPEPAVHPGAHSTAESTIGKEDRFEGTLHVQRGLRVLGQVNGQIEAATSVTIEEGAKVEADLTADEAIIAGEYTGKLVCRQRLEIRSTGLVKGDIETVRLMLHEGGFIDGALHMQKSAAAATASTAESARSGDTVRSGISARSTSESVVEATSPDAVREPAAAGVRGSTQEGASSSSR